MSRFKIIASDGKARAGILKTAHGMVETPVFMPVGTQATVKALSPEDLKKVGAQVILGNTYHLYLRPGSRLINKHGGLHRFMGWNGPILTDSGGFQAFSLGAMIKHGVGKVSRKETDLTGKGGSEQKSLVSQISEKGVEFVSNLDGSKHLLTPEKSIQVQLDLGSDICLVLDELLSPLSKPEYVRQSLDRTHQWEQRGREYFQEKLAQSTNAKAQLFGILQGVYDQEIREKEARWVASQEFDGVSIGGSFGTSPYWGQEEESVDWAAARAIYETMDWVVPILPKDWPRHALGIGEVQDLFECVKRGVDMFDCVAPTRRARNGSLYLGPGSGGSLENKFALTISKAEFRDDQKPVDPGCECYTCGHFSRAYLRHLYTSSELLYFRLATIHNLYFILNLTRRIREAVIHKELAKLTKPWLN